MACCCAEKKPAKKRFKIYAVATDKRGRLISVGENSYTKTHPLMQHYSDRVGLYEKIFLHAEVQALLRAGEKKVYTLSVSRFDAKGREALAKPCPVCMEAIKAFGVKRIEYTVKGGTVQEDVEYES